MNRKDAVKILRGRLAAAGLTVDAIDIADREYSVAELDDMIAAAYIRVSTDDQTELSPESQLEKIREAVRSQNRILPNEYIFVEEDGRSGRKVKGRDAFIEMIATAKNPPLKFSTLYLWVFSRFARNQEESVLYKSLLRKQCGVEIVSVSEPLPEGPFGELIERIIEWMDEYYSIRLSKEVKRSMTLKAQRGGLQSTPAFGYRVEDNTLVVVPEEAEYVRELFRRFVDGAGYYSLAVWLNSCGVTTHRGGRWENRTVEYLIRNPVYIGKLRWTPGGRMRRDYDRDDTIIADAKHEAIIDVGLWEEAQSRVAEIKTHWRPYQKPAEQHRDWLSGLVECSVCGASLSLNRKQHSWRCSHYARGRCNTSQSIMDERLKGLVFSALRHDLTSGAPLSLASPDTAPASKSAAQLRNRLTQLKRSVNRLRDAYLVGAETAEEYAAAKQALEAEIAAVEKELDAPITNQKPKAQQDAKIRKQITAAIKVLTDPNSDIAHKYEVAHDLISRATYDKASNSFSITYKG